MIARLNKRQRVIIHFTFLVLSLSTSEAVAQKPDTSLLVKPVSNTGFYEKLWQVPGLYRNDKAALIQQFSLVGRYHGQYWNVNAEQGSAKGWENRRMYFGAEAILFHKFTVHAQFKISEDFNPFYEGLYQAYVKWAPSESLSLSAGRLDYLYTGLERSVSSTRIVTIERGLLPNQLLPNEVVGTLVQGKSGKVSYRAGIFSGSIGDEFTNFEGGFGALASFGFELPLLYKNGSIHVDYLYNNGNSLNNAFKPYSHIISLWHHGQSGAFSSGVEFVAANGTGEHKSLLGITVMPKLIIGKSLILKGDQLEMAVRYQYAESKGENGLLLQKRYEQDVVPSGSGNIYQAIYTGLNWLLCGDKLKLMTGLEYSVMKDSANDGGSFKGWSSSAGVRLYF
jgi:phosphate-selective porin OprO and OprP